MTEQEAKVLAAELEHNKYWRVESIGTPHHACDACCTVVIRHRVNPKKSWYCVGEFDVASLMRQLIEDGPRYAEDSQ